MTACKYQNLTKRQENELKMSHVIMFWKGLFIYTIPYA